MSGPPLRVLVCGTNFGRFYAEAVREREGYELVGLLARGSDASRAYADKLGVPLHTSPPEDGVDLACVAVGSAISGGTGAELALDLLARGVHVLQEHPLHLDELTACVREARRQKLHYRINTHYPHLAPVRRFVTAARRLAERQQPLFVDAATPVHLMMPLVDILGRALGTLRPWRFADPAPLVDGSGPAPFRTLHGVIGGVPLTLRVHHQLDPADRDNHALHWHRIALGTEGGVLTLADTHGPVLWSPRLHAERDADHRLVLDGPGTASFGLPTTSVIGEPGTFRQVFDEMWPDAIGRAVDGMRDAVLGGGPGTAGPQYDLAVCRIWSELATRLGPPTVVRPPRPRPLPAEELFDAPSEQPAPVAYTPSAEFFDLVAAEHVATSSAPAVAAALGGLDTGTGTVVDIGAGTGLVTEAVARALPGAAILAAEPAVGMRAVLTSRVFGDPDLRPRVTVTDSAAPDLELPDRISAAVLCGVLGHLDAGQRRRLWSRLLARLAPGGRIVVELMQLDAPAELPPSRLATATAGRHRYEWWFSGVPEGAGAMRLRSTWRIYEEASPAPLREVHDAYLWEPFGLDTLAEESGLLVRPMPVRPGAPPLAVLSREPLSLPRPTEDLR
ncbi:Gfo/Idh/MocA family oxidoreductase [Streptomyces sp. TS71-3]|uniref:Gfo/Idh/MocA family oxidoreductase n=1 Tax=Streptomyces sp. TS71-3 TaxID=2733862 RepID=UPI001B18A52F|nr:Gfo/Idh/MocA family oxidoreductase [Streptomyces sp. TS71-3]GHJ35182.1 thiazolinyl imide reductase [Streptomyces sp. TS71-3]